MTRCLIGLLVILALGCLVAPLTAAAQPVGKVYRVGYLAVGLSPTPAAPYPVNIARFGTRGLPPRGLGGSGGNGGAGSSHSSSGMSDWPCTRDALTCGFVRTSKSRGPPRCKEGKIMRKPSLTGTMAPILFCATVMSAVVVPATAQPLAGAQSCGVGVNTPPSTIDLGTQGHRIRDAIRCLLNAERTSRSLEDPPASHNIPFTTQI
jgi:hypothetical protein